MDSSDNNEWSSLEDYPNYQINREGQLRNTKTGTKIIPKTSPNKKYIYCQIEDRHGIMKTPRIDQLVAETFLPRKAKQTAVIVHLDGNINNCSADNLIWDDEEYYAKQYYLNTGIQKPKEYFIFYPLMEFPDSQYEINKMGQIRNKYTYKILTGGLASGGYRAHTLRINKKTVFRLAHLMVAKQFIPNPENKPLVNHIDEDKSNPCIDNLEWVTGAENVHHGTALHRGNLGRNKPVNEYNIQGRYLRTWKSKKALADFLDLLFPNINNIHTVHYLLQFNLQNPGEKKAFANRVFTYYDGNCDDIEFHVQNMNYKKYNNPSLDGIDIPDDYLIFDFDDKVDSLDVLQEMTSSRMHLSVRQKQAIRYAITCIKKVKESEIVVNKLAKVIADYKSIQK